MANFGVTEFRVVVGENTQAAANSATAAAASAADAAQSAAYAGGFEVPEYASQSAGNAATTAGQIFRVPLGTTPQTFNWFRRLSSGSELVDPLATSGALAASGGAALIGTTDGGTVQGALNGYATRAAVKALTATAGARTYLTEAGREGEFIFRAGDFAARIAADTAEGVYLKADSVAASAGAWVRQHEGVFQASWFGIVPTTGFDNGPNLRAAKNILELIGSNWTSWPLVFGIGTYEVSTAEGDGAAAVRFQKACDIRGQGYLATQIHWKTSTAQVPLFLVDPTTANACWGVKFANFAIHARTGAAAGSGIKIEMDFPSAAFGFDIDSVRVVGCYNGIQTNNVGGTTVYGGVIRNCSVEQVINSGRGFDIGGSYIEMDNCEAYPSFDGTGNTAFAFYLTAGWSKFRNLRAAGPVYGDAPFSEIDITVEGQASDCVHNSAVVRINRMKKIRCVLVGARKSSVSTPRYGLLLQDTGYVIEYFQQQDASGYSSCVTPIILGGTGTAALLMAEASGVGVLKPEDDPELAFDPTMGGRLKIIDGGTWTNYGQWTATFDPPSIAAGASATVDVSCPGLRSGSVPLAASFSVVNADIDVSCKYLSATQVQVRFSNRGASPVDLGSGTITVSALNVP